MSVELFVYSFVYCRWIVRTGTKTLASLLVNPHGPVIIAQNMYQYKTDCYSYGFINQNIVSMELFLCFIEYSWHWDPWALALGLWGLGALGPWGGGTACGIPRRKQTLQESQNRTNHFHLITFTYGIPSM